MGKKNGIIEMLFAKENISIPLGQAVLLFFVLGFGLLLFKDTIQVCLLNTILIFFFVNIFGLLLCKVVQRKLGDSKLSLVGNLWLIKLSLVLLFLYLGWIPQLDPSSGSWGYDPQRYYRDSYNLINDKWIPAIGMNYQGIIYYYAVIFFLFGHNPVIPALINSFVTLLGTLYLIRVLYEFKGSRGAHDWTVAFVLLIPEMLWYDVMTCRETLMAVLMTVGSLSAGRYIVGSSRVTFSTTMLLSGICLIAIIAVRTTMAIPVVASIILISLMLNPRRRREKIGFFPKVIIIMIAISIISLGPLIQQMTSSYTLDYSLTFNRIQSVNESISSSSGWSQNSIGLLLAPHNALQSILYLPPRMVLYLLSPLPIVRVSIPELIAGRWFEWQHLMSLITSILNIIVAPFAIAGFVTAFKRRAQYPRPLVLHFTFWITFAAIAGGNIIIHDRYRVMMSLLFFGSAWMGYTSCTKEQIQRFLFYWYGVLFAGTLFFLFMKKII